MADKKKRELRKSRHRTPHPNQKRRQKAQSTAGIIVLHEGALSNVVQHIVPFEYTKENYREDVLQRNPHEIARYKAI